MLLAGGPLAWSPLAWGPVDAAPPADVPRTIRDAVRSMLAGLPGLVEIVGGRIRYAGSGQGDPEPRVTYFIPSRTRGVDIDGPDGQSYARVRVSVWSLDADEAESMAAIVGGLDGFTGWVGSVYIDSFDYSSEIDLPEPLGDGTESTVYQIVVEFEAEHKIEVVHAGA